MARARLAVCVACLIAIAGCNSDLPAPSSGPRTSTAIGASRPPGTLGGATRAPAGVTATPGDTPSSTGLPVEATLPPLPTDSPSAPQPTPKPGTNAYAGAGIGMYAPGLADLPPRVYVPDELNGTVVVIDPLTRKVIDSLKVGTSPEHITPDWDLSRLLVNVTYDNKLTPIDIHTGKLGTPIDVPGPYNLYFSLDGSKAIVIRDSRHAPADQVYFYDRSTWQLLKTLSIKRAGADHLDMSADGSYMLMSAEYDGYVIKIDIAAMQVVGELKVGGSPVDVRLAPDGSVFFVTNQLRGGVSIIDPRQMRQIGFIATDAGAHGLALSRDDTQLFVTNRYAGTLSVIDIAARTLLRTWPIGGTPDMISLSPDGAELWISNRYSGSVSVVNSRSGKVLATIHTGGHPHGLAYFPEPGSLSLGHNGIYR